MKAMPAGPLIIPNWSSVRDDIPRSKACRQIALTMEAAKRMRRRPG